MLKHATPYSITVAMYIPEVLHHTWGSVSRDAHKLNLKKGYEDLTHARLGGTMIAR